MKKSDCLMYEMRGPKESVLMRVGRGNAKWVWVECEDVKDMVARKDKRLLARIGPWGRTLWLSGKRIADSRIIGGDL